MLLLAVVMASGILKVMYGWCFREALNHPLPGMLSRRGIFLGFSSRKDLAEACTLSNFNGNPFVWHSIIHLIKEVSSALLSLAYRVWSLQSSLPKFTATSELKCSCKLQLHFAEAYHSLLHLKHRLHPPICNFCYI